MNGIFVEEGEKVVAEEETFQVSFTFCEECLTELECFRMNLQEDAT